MKFTFKTVTNESGTRTVHAKGISTNGYKFEGKAICSPNDQFFFGVGRVIAETRARIKQLKKILANELLRNQKIITMQNKSDREIEKLCKQLEDLESYESNWTR